MCISVERLHIENEIKRTPTNNWSLIYMLVCCFGSCAKLQNGEGTGFQWIFYELHFFFSSSNREYEKNNESKNCNYNWYCHCGCNECSIGGVHFGLCRSQGIKKNVKNDFEQKLLVWHSSFHFQCLSAEYESEGKWKKNNKNLIEKCFVSVYQIHFLWKRWIKNGVKWKYKRKTQIPYENVFYNLNWCKKRGVQSISTCHFTILQA